jgi:hypothetical protein
VEIYFEMAKVILTSKISAMKSVLPVLATVMIFASCSTAYKSGQTPDDVYYSPERPKEYVRTEKKEDKRNDYTEGEYRDDRYIRMKIRDRRYVDLYDDYYSYNPYYYHYYNSSLYYNSPWNSVTYWNYYYNPACTPCYVCGTYPTKVVTRTPRKFDLSVYNSGTSTAKGINVKGGATSYGTSGYSSRNYGSGRTNTNNYGGTGRNAGDFIRDAFGGSNNSSTKGTSSGSSSSSSGSSSSGSSGSRSSNAPARRF